MTGIFLSLEILQDNNLSLQEKLILSMVKNMGQLYMTNNTLSNLLGISKSRVSHLVSSLKSKGYVDVALVYNENRQVEKRTVTLSKVMQVVDKIKEKVTGGKNKEIKQQKAQDNADFTTVEQTVGTARVQQVKFANGYYKQNKRKYGDGMYSHNFDFDEIDRLEMEHLSRKLEGWVTPDKYKKE